MALRFFQVIALCLNTGNNANTLKGFVGSPCLATGGASMGDMYPFTLLPYMLTAWVSAAYAGPSLGPLLSAFAVEAKNWHWALWEILWMSAPVFLLMFFALPETSAANILLRRARRLRAVTGNTYLRSQSEIDQSKLSAGKVAWDSLIKPLEITFMDPSVFFTHLYTSVMYGIYYSFFEVFPLVFPPKYGFTLGTMGVLFTCILVACVLGMAAYCGYLYFILDPDIRKNGMRAQEHRLVPGLFAVFLCPIGLFLFGWTANGHTPWIVPTIGIVFYAAGSFVLLQCIFLYLPMSYPAWAASLFAGNDAFRSMLAAGCILFARPLYQNLGIGPGISLLASFMAVAVLGYFALWWFGASLRKRSRFAAA